MQSRGKGDGGHRGASGRGRPPARDNETPSTPVQANSRRDEKEVISRPLERPQTLA